MWFYFLFFKLLYILNKSDNNNINNDNDDDDDDDNNNNNNNNNNDNKWFKLNKFQILYIYLLMSLCVLVHKPSSLRFESFETEEILILKKKYNSKTYSH